MTFTSSDLPAILASHGAWLRGENDGNSANLRTANLYGANLRSANLRSADLRSADLRSANLCSADLRSANLYGADLRSADLCSADLRSANLRSADLRSANLCSANLYGADLRGADLCNADLRSANLCSADLRSANLYGADLRSAKGIVDAGHRGDGYRFVGYVKNGVIMVRAGCRDFTMEQARKHWQDTRGNTLLGDETMSILDHIERGMVSRGLIPITQTEAA